MLDIKPCLWFPAEAEEAANFYVSLFPNSEVANVMRGAPGTPAIAVDFTLDGRPFLALNGRWQRGFTDACSFAVPCETQADIDRYWNALTRGGGARDAGDARHAEARRRGARAGARRRRGVVGARGPAADQRNGPTGTESESGHRHSWTVARISFLYAIRCGWSASGPLRRMRSSIYAWQFPST